MFFLVPQTYPVCSLVKLNCGLYMCMDLLKVAIDPIMDDNVITQKPFRNVSLSLSHKVTLLKKKFFFLLKTLSCACIYEYICIIRTQVTI